MEENEEEIVPKVNIFTICIHACSTFTMLEEHNIGVSLEKVHKYESMTLCEQKWVFSVLLSEKQFGFRDNYCVCNTGHITMLARKISCPKAIVSKLKVFISRKTTHFLERFCISWRRQHVEKVDQYCCSMGKCLMRRISLSFEKFRQNVVKRTCST